MGEMVVLGWVLLELTDSPFMVGVGLGVRLKRLLEEEVEDVIDDSEYMANEGT